VEVQDKTCRRCCKWDKRTFAKDEELLKLVADSGCDADIFQETMEFCDTNNVNLGQSTILTPFPGTDLFNRLKNQNKILTYDWRYYDGEHCVFRPKNISAQELEEGLFQVYKDFYSWRLIKRIIKKSTIKKYLKG
jgi:hypothetical protein